MSAEGIANKGEAAGESGIVLAGAGIAGMVTALALAKHNISSAIYEKSSVLQEVGAGIQLAPNATSLLRDLNILDALAPYIVEPEFINLSHAGSGEALLRLPIKSAAQKRWGAPYFTIHRADFQKVLKEKIDQSPLIHYCGGAALSEIEGNREAGFRALLAQPENPQNMPPAANHIEQARQTAAQRQAAAWAAAQTPQAQFGENNNIQRVEARQIICCDGVWSRLRAACGERADFSSYIAWRANLKAEDLPQNFIRHGALDSVSAYMGRDSHFIIYPLRQGKLYNFVIVTKGQYSRQSLRRADKADLLQLFTGQAPLLRELIERAPDWTYWPLYQMPFPRFLGQSDEIFLGDAAHAVTPFAAQGAAMAIEDGCALAQILAENQADISANKGAAALARFNAVRQKRLRNVAKRGDFNRFVYHLSGAAAFARNCVLRLRPQSCFLRDLDWLYGYDALAPLRDSQAAGY